jgi:thiamine-phosphate pyrophosphorylase
MPETPLLYYITDRAAFPGDERTRRIRLLDKITEAASQDVDYIQLREKDLPVRDLESLAREAMRILRKLRTENRELRTAFLINSRTDVALATSADGVHLRAADVSPQEVRTVWTRAACNCGARAPAREISPRNPVIGVSCHSPQDVLQSASNHATFAIFAPVFEKKDAQPTGLEALRQACQARIPVLALGGVTLQNAQSCLQAGAAGIAAIRLFQENDIAMIVRRLRS